MIKGNYHPVEDILKKLYIKWNTVIHILILCEKIKVEHKYKMQFNMVFTKKLNKLQTR